MSAVTSTPVSRLFDEMQERINQLTAERDAAREALAEVMAAQAARIAELEAGLKAACGYLMNALIDLEAGATKKTAADTIRGGLTAAKAALSTPGPTKDGA
jgi:predicted transcriptional regulator